MRYRMPFLGTLVLLFLVGSAPAALGGTARFVRYPDIPGETIVFTWEGDLFSAPASGGPARRITTHPGNEEEPKFSPDGATIAFRASYDGANDVYVMPTGGGNTIAPTGKAYKINMATFGHWNRDGVMDKEYLFWDNQTFMNQIGLGK